MHMSTSEWLIARCVYSILGVVALLGCASNFSLFYVTLRSKKLRSTCHLLIGLCGLLDGFHGFGTLYQFPVLFSDGLIDSSICSILQIFPEIGVLGGMACVLCIGLERLIAVVFVGRYRAFGYRHLMVHLIIIAGFAIYALTLMALFFVPTRQICAIPAPFHGKATTLWSRAFIILNSSAVIVYCTVAVIIAKRPDITTATRKAFQSIFFVMTSDVSGWIVCNGCLQFIVHFAITEELAFIVAYVAGLFVNLGIGVKPAIYYLTNFSFCEKLNRSDFGFYYDSDHFIDFARMSRLIGCTLSIFILHPMTIYVIVKKSSMAVDCKAGIVCHTSFLLLFDAYNGYFHQLYTLVPLPIIMCTGLLCNGMLEPATLLVILSFFTVAVIVPNLFLMLRVHQRMLFASSPLKLSDTTQIAILLTLNVLLFSNVFGFWFWTVDNPNKNDLLNREDMVWAHDFTSTFLVLGEHVGDIGVFERELLLLLTTILIILPAFLFINYHAIYKVGKQMGVRNSKAHQAQMRLVYNLAVQAAEASIFFVSPLILLFIGLYAYRESWQWPPLFAATLRFMFLMFYSFSPLAHSIIYLGWNPWFREIILSKFRKGSTQVQSAPATITK